jgi:hypothetical protein
VTTNKKENKSMYDPLSEVDTYEDDGVSSFSFEDAGDTVEGEITKIADRWTHPKLNKWGNLMTYLPITVCTDSGDHWRLWPSAQVYEDSGRKSAKEFTRTLSAAVRDSGGTLGIGGRLKVRYDGKERRTLKNGTEIEVGTYTMRYTPPAPSTVVDLDEF